MGPADILDTTVGSVVADHAADRPTATAFASGSEVLSYGDLYERGSRVAGWLTERGFGKGDRVALWLPNGPAWVIAQLGITMSGAAVVPVNTRLRQKEADYVFRHSQSALVFAASSFLERNYAAEATEAVGDSAEVLAVDPAISVIGVEGNRVADSAQPDDIAMVIYTSGTTGDPKGCCLSHRTWTNNARFSATVAGLTPSDVVFSPSPFFHVFGSLTGLMAALSVGATFVTTQTFKVETALDALKHWQVTHLVAVPTMWLDIMHRVQPGELPALRGGVWGGGAFPHPILERALDPNEFGWNLQSIYGLTEAPTLTQVRPEDPIEAKIQTVGRATPGVDLRVVTSDGSLVKAGESGEVQARGYVRMSGYLDDPEATAARFDGDWVRTGDIGILDRGGFLRIVGRTSDMIVSGAANVYPREVEDVLIEIEGVALAAVVGAPDARLGEIPVAWIEPRPGSVLKAQSIIGYCRANMAGYKVPQHVFFVDEMPLTGGGKVRKAVLTEWTREALMERVPS